MSERKAKLEKALACPENLYNYPWQDAAEWESKRLAPLHAALLEAVEALDWIKPILHGEELQHAEEALSKIDKVLEEI